MAKLSRNARGKARKKRTISLQNREIRQLKAAFFNTHQMLLMVLGQSGGEVTVTQGTMQQILQQAQRVNWQTAPGANEHEFIVRLVTQMEEPPAEPTITEEPRTTSISEFTRLSDTDPAEGAD